MRRCPTCERRWPTIAERAVRRQVRLHGLYLTLGFMAGLSVTYFYWLGTL